ncbi:hypothetical protein ABVT43_03265 [Aliikangiella sp. GXAS 311]
MQYLDGHEIQLGDLVMFECGQTQGIVDVLIETESAMQEWQVDTPGVLLKSTPFGSVFWPINDTRDPLVFISRHSS